MQLGTHWVCSNASPWKYLAHDWNLNLKHEKSTHSPVTLRVQHWFNKPKRCKPQSWKEYKKYSLICAYVCLDASPADADNTLLSHNANECGYKHGILTQHTQNTLNDTNSCNKTVPQNTMPQICEAWACMWGFYWCLHPLNVLIRASLLLHCFLIPAVKESTCCTHAVGGWVRAHAQSNMMKCSLNAVCEFTSYS